MRLTTHQREMLEGDHGWPKRIALEMLVAVGRVYDAPDLIPVRSVHLGVSGKSLGQPGMELLESLASRGGRFVVPTSLNVLSVSRTDCASGARTAEEEWQLRILKAAEAMGAVSICSCNPFLLGIAPRTAESVAWNESATAPYINAVLGGRTNREGATALASALTGLTPRYGMHIEAQRRGTFLIELDAVVQGVDQFSVLGALVGRVCGNQIPVIDGLTTRPTQDEYMAFGAALAMHSDVAMYHMVPFTPEAPSRGTALGYVEAPSIRIDESDLHTERRRHTNTPDRRVDVISVGCPHASIGQIREIAEAIQGRRTADGVEFYLHTSESILAEAKNQGLLAVLRAASVQVTADHCIHVSFLKLTSHMRVATNSVKMAHLVSSDGSGVYFGSAKECVEAAVAGRWPDPDPN